MLTKAWRILKKSWMTPSRNLADNQLLRPVLWAKFSGRNQKTNWLTANLFWLISPKQADNQASFWAECHFVDDSPNKIGCQPVFYGLKPKSLGGGRSGVLVQLISVDLVTTDRGQCMCSLEAQYKRHHGTPTVAVPYAVYPD
jgi:hypothetical protein